MYVSSVTLVHPAKAVGWNEMPFCRDTRVIPSNIVSDKGFRSPHGKRIFGGWSSQRCRLLPNNILWSLF